MAVKPEDDKTKKPPFAKKDDDKGTDKDTDNGSDTDDEDKEKTEESYRPEDQPAPVSLSSVLDLKKMVKESVDASQDSTKEHVDALFGAETLTEDFKTRASVLWGASVNQAVEDRVTKISEQVLAEADKFIAESRERFETALEERVDAYLSYVVETWAEENRLALETGIRAELAEGFMQKLHAVFSESYIEVPEAKVDLVEDLQKKVDELTVNLREATDAMVTERQRANDLTKAAIFRDLTEGLTDTQTEKLRSLTESVSFDTVDNYKKNVMIIKESYLANKPDASTDEGKDKSKPATGIVSKYQEFSDRMAARNKW